MIDTQQKRIKIWLEALLKNKIFRKGLFLCLKLMIT